MKYANWILLLVACLFLNGCGSFEKNLYGGYAAPDLDLSTNRIKDFYKKVTDQLPDSKYCFAGSEAAPVTVTVDCKVKRNEVVSFLMAESTYLCTDHLNTIYGKEAAVNISTGSISALASGLAAVSTGGQAAHLSALSAFATAERSLINETVYKSMLTSAIATKIGEMREQKGKALLVKKKEELADYTMEEAIHEVLDYHASCSFRRGLEVALAEGTNLTPEAKRMQLEAKANVLMNQITTYAETNDLTATQYQLSSDGRTSAQVTDPFIKYLLDQYIIVSKKITELY